MEENDEWLSMACPLSKSSYFLRWVMIHFHSASIHHASQCPFIHLSWCFSGKGNGCQMLPEILCSGDRRQPGGGWPYSHCSSSSPRLGRGKGLAHPWWLVWLWSNQPQAWRNTTCGFSDKESGYWERGFPSLESKFHRTRILPAFFTAVSSRPGILATPRTLCWLKERKEEWMISMLPTSHLK